MRLQSKVFLALAILLWAIDYTPVGREKLYGIPTPLAAVFFGLFLITWILPHRDFEQFEEDQALRNHLISNERKMRRQRLRSRLRWRPGEAEKRQRTAAVQNLRIFL